ncbi:MAG TPA: AraC family transcriptional regulator [Polyangiaceae bacterium]
MDSVEFQGDARDLERFAQGVLKQTVFVDEPSPREHRMRWRAGGSAGFASVAEFCSGLKLSASRHTWDQPWRFQFRDARTPLKFMLSRGAAPRFTRAAEIGQELGDGRLHVSHSTQTVITTCEFVQESGEFEHLALEIDPARLRELLGAPTLPRALEELLTSAGPHTAHEQPMAPALSCIFDEILYADARGTSRGLFLEAKGLELLATLLDELAPASEALEPLGRRDAERLEHARLLLMERMACPPTLRELARAVGLNEFKLKAGFRAQFGASVFGYLRTQRMELARRLLLQRGLSVTEVALKVGYANPSKFAAAFRKHFALPPSAFR